MSKAEYIDIEETNPTDPNWPRTSSLAVYADKPALLTVGNLPHGYEWRPKTEQDRDMLVLFLNGLEYLT